MAVRKSPIYRVMIGGRMLGGVEYNLAVTNAIVAAMVVLGGHHYSYILVALLVHALLKQAYGADPDVRRVYMRYFQHAHRAEPWPQAGSRKPRPTGWAAQ